MRLAVVDDHGPDLEQVAAVVAMSCDEMGLLCEVDTFTSGADFRAAYAPGRYDVLVLDVLMGEDSGIEVARAVRESEPDLPIVFTTVSREYAVDGFEVGAAHYMIKPVDKAQMRAALARCGERLALDNRYIEVSIRRRAQRVLMRDIIFADHYKNATQLHTTGEMLRVYVAFKEIAASLLRDERFLECTYGCVINMDHVLKLENNVFVMDDGTRVPLRTKKSAGARSRYLDWMFAKTRRG